MIHLFYSLLFVGLFLYLGAGLALLLTPPALTRYSLLIAPLVGYCYMTLAGWYFFAGGLPGTDSYALFLCIPPIGFLCFGMYWRMRGNDGLRPLFNKDVAIASLLGLPALIVVALPWMTSGRGLTAISLGNADIAYYAVQARYLKGFRMYERIGFFDQEPAILAAAHARFGPVLASALPSSVFSLETYQLQNIVMQAFFACTVLMIYIVGREIFRYTSSQAAVGTALAALSPLLFYAVYHNFAGQIIGMPLAFALVVLHAQAVRRGTIGDYLRYFPLTALLTFGFSISYGHMLPLLLAAIGAQVAILAWRRRSATDLRRWMAFSLASLVATIVASPEQARLAVGQLLFYGSGVGSVVRTPEGWFVPWLFPAGLFALPNAFPWSGITQRTVVRIAVLTAFTVPFALGMVASYRTDRERFVAVLSWSAVILAGTTALAYLDRSALGWGGYASYKWLSFFLPFILFALVAPMASPARRDRPRVVVSGACLALLMFVSAYYSSRESLKMMSVEFVGEETAQLRSIETDPRVDSVSILEDPGDTLNTMWRANFLARKRVYLEQRTYFAPSELRGDWTLLSRNEPGYGGVLHMGGDSSQTIRINEKYFLVPSTRALGVRFGDGWWPQEPMSRWMGNGSTSAELLLDVATEQMPVSFAAEYWPLNPGNKLSIYLDRHLLTECHDNSSCATGRFDLTRGQHVLEFRTALPPARPDNGDLRTLSYLFSKIEINQLR